MKKRRTQFLIATILVIILSIPVCILIIKNYSKQSYYTISNDDAAGPVAHCLSIGPECNYVDIALKDSESKTKNYKYFQPEVISENGDRKTEEDLKTGTRVKIETKLFSNDNYISKFIILN